MSVKQGVFLAAAWLAMLWAYTLNVEAVYAASETMANITAIGTIISPIAVLVVGYLIARAGKRQDRENEERKEQRKVEAEERETVRREAAEDRRLAREAAARAQASAESALVATREVARKQAEAAVKVEAVKVALVETTTKTEAKLEHLGIATAAVLHLVNSGTAAQLRLRIDEARVRVKERDTEDSRTLLATAERLFAEHMANQDKADAAAGGAQKIVDAGLALANPKEETTP